MTREERKQWYYEQTHKIIDNIIYKQCTVCKEWCPDTEEYFYWRNKNKPEKGFQSECKKCSSNTNNNRQKANYDKYKEYRAEWIEKSNNKENVNNTARQWREENQEWKQKYQLNYYKNNPDKMKIYNQNKQQHKKHNISKTEWENCKRYFNYKCAYCGLPIEEHYFTRNGIIKLGDFHKEHVDHKGSNDLSNCVPSCGSCNDHKWKFDFDYWYNTNNERYSQERYDKIIKWLTDDYKVYIEPPKPKRTYTRKELNRLENKC